MKVNEEDINDGVEISKVVLEWNRNGFEWPAG